MWSWQTWGKRMAEKLIFCLLNNIAPHFTAFGAETMAEIDDRARLDLLPGWVSNPMSNSVLDVSSDGRYLISTGDAAPYLAVRDMQTGLNLSLSGWTYTAGGSRVAISPDGTKLAIARSSSPRLIVLNLSSGGAAFTIGTLPSYSLSCLAWSPDSTKLLVGNSNTLEAFGLRIYNAADWSFSNVTTSTPTVISVAWKPDGTQFAAGYSSGTTVRVFNAADFTEPTIPVQPAFAVNHLAWSPDAAFIACGGLGAQITVLNASTYAVAANVTPATSGIRDMKWKPGTGKLYCVYDTGATRVTAIDSADWSQSTPAGATTTHALRGIVFSNTDMRRITTGTAQILNDAGSPAAGRIVRMYDRTSGALIMSKTTDASGQFLARYASWGQVDLRVLDDDAGTTYNDLTFARVTPAVAP